MKKHMKKLVAMMVAAALMLAMAACGNAGSSSQAGGNSQAASQGGGDTTAAGEVSQGVTDSEILIGCTYATSGNWAFIGVPIVDTLQAVFDRINENGGIQGRQIRLIHYDDEYDPAKGKSLLEKLVEEDKVFALCFLGGNIVGNSLDYLHDYGIPVVNISSGLDVIYREQDIGGNIFPVQPSGYTDGQFLLARVLHESIFGPGKDEKLPEDAKIGVLHTTAEGSMNNLSGLMVQAEREGVTDRLVIETVTADTYPTAIQKFKSEGVQVLISMTTDSKNVTAAMDDANWEVPYIGAYGSSTPQSYSVETYKEGRPIYCTTWAEYTTPEAQATLDDLDDALKYNKSLDDATRESYQNNLYAFAGYAGVTTLSIGLQRMDEANMDLTWANLIAALESAPIDEPQMGAYGYIDYANGARMGVTKMAFTEFVPNPEGGTEGIMLSTRTYESLEDIMAK